MSGENEHCPRDWKRGRINQLIASEVERLVREAEHYYSKDILRGEVRTNSAPKLNPQSARVLRRVINEANAIANEEYGND